VLIFMPHGLTGGISLHRVRSGIARVRTPRRAES
jgi:hypothetical protein